MPLSPQAEQELRQMLGAFRAAHGGAVVPTAQGKALEAWVLMRLAYSIDQLCPEWLVSLRRGDGSPLPPGQPFQLPSGPSAIAANNPAAPGFIYFEHSRYPERRFELRASAQWKGRSGARHEIDISMLPASISEALRQHGGGYPRGLPVVAIECKDKYGYGKLDETRETLARMYDLVLVTQPLPAWSCRIYETKSGQRWGRKKSRYISFFQKGTFAIVRAGSFQQGAGSLAAHYSIQHRPNIYTDPGAMAALEAHFRHTLWSIATF
jgi:hypothetical protein